MPNDSVTERLVRDYVEAITSRDLERVYAFYADDIVYEDVAVAQTYRGLGRVKRFYAASMAALDVTWQIDTVCATDERYGLAWRMSGTHVGDLPGMPATGRRYEVPGASMGEVRGGRIVHNRDFWSLLDLLRQLELR